MRTCPMAVSPLAPILPVGPILKYLTGLSGNTIHSVGIGSSSERKNAVEVMQNGDVYVLGVGGYDGKEISSAATLKDAIGNAGGSMSLYSLSSGVYGQKWRYVGSSSINVSQVSQPTFQNGIWSCSYFLEGSDNRSASAPGTGDETFLNLLDSGEGVYIQMERLLDYYLKDRAVNSISAGTGLTVILPEKNPGKARESYLYVEGADFQELSVVGTDAGGDPVAMVSGPEQYSSGLFRFLEVKEGSFFVWKT